MSFKLKLVHSTNTFTSGDSGVMKLWKTVMNLESERLPKLSAGGLLANFREALESSNTRIILFVSMARTMTLSSSIAEADILI